MQALREVVGSAGDTGTTSVTVELTGHVADVLWALGTTAQECEGWWGPEWTHFTR